MRLQFWASLLGAGLCWPAVAAPAPHRRGRVGTRAGPSRAVRRLVRQGHAMFSKGCFLAILLRLLTAVGAAAC